MDLLKYFWTNRMPREVVLYFLTLAQLSPQHILCSVKWTTYFLSTSSFSSFFHGQYTFISSTTQQENRASNLSAPVYQCISCTDGPKLDAGPWTWSNELPGALSLHAHDFTVVLVPTPEVLSALGHINVFPSRPTLSDLVSSPARVSCTMSLRSLIKTFKGAGHNMDSCSVLLVSSTQVDATY